MPKTVRAHTQSGTSIRCLSHLRRSHRLRLRRFRTLFAATVCVSPAVGLAGGRDPASHASLRSPAGRTLLDVGGGPGYFAAAFAEAGVGYIGVEPDPGEMHAGGPAVAGGTGTFVRASGMALPFADDSV